MLYDVALRIEHLYDPPADSGRHLIRLLPAAIPLRQSLVAALVDVRPTPAERSDRTDFFGNATTEVAFRSVHASVEFAMTARVRLSPVAPPDGGGVRLADLPVSVAAVRSLAPGSPHHMVHASPRIRLDPEITAFARDYAGADTPAIAAVAAVGEALFRSLRFDAEATGVDTTPGEAFHARHGVCQDFAQIMIAALRGVGVPAGYVSGFLRTVPPPGSPRLEGADAMHAWVRAWCGPGVGWVEYDPTNGRFAGADHIVVAFGRDYSDVAPVKGVLRSAGRQDSRHAVDVVAVDGP